MTYAAGPSMDDILRDRSVLSDVLTVVYRSAARWATRRWSPWVDTSRESKYRVDIELYSIVVIITEIVDIQRYCRNIAISSMSNNTFNQSVSQSINQSINQSVKKHPFWAVVNKRNAG